jgi:hypothetical protein
MDYTNNQLYFTGCNNERNNLWTIYYRHKVVKNYRSHSKFYSRMILIVRH